jgi:hypothetical protein
LLYGRHIFQLCVGTLLAGIDLADRADLQEKFVSNNERYQRICELLKTESVPPTERLLAVEPFLRALKRYQFVPTGEVSRGALISAVRHAASALNAGEHPLEPNLAEPLTKVQAITRKEDELQQLTAIKELAEAFEAAEQADLTPEARVVRELVEFAWMGLFQIYYWLIDHQQT